MDVSPGFALLILFFVSVVPGLFGAWLASTKHRSPVAWFFLCALFSWLALIVLGFSAPGVDHAHVSLPPPTKKCPECGEEVLVEATICRFCRHQFGRAKTQSAVSLARELEECESLGVWVVRDSSDDRLERHDHIHLGIGPTRLLVVFGKDPVLAVNLSEARLEVADDLMVRLSDGGALLVTLDWEEGPKAKAAARMLTAAQQSL